MTLDDGHTYLERHDCYREQTSPQLRPVFDLMIRSNAGPRHAAATCRYAEGVLGDKNYIPQETLAVDYDTSDKTIWKYWEKYYKSLEDAIQDEQEDA